MLRNVLCFVMRNQEGEVAELEGCLCHSFVRSPVPRSEEEGCVRCISQFRIMTADVLLETLQSRFLSAASPILAEDLGGAGRAKNVFAKCCRESS